MPRAKKGQQKVLTLKKKTGLCTSRCYYCPTWNPFDVRVTRNRSKDDNHAKPVPRKICRVPFSVWAHSMGHPAWSQSEKSSNGEVQKKKKFPLPVRTLGGDIPNGERKLETILMLNITM